MIISRLMASEHFEDSYQVLRVFPGGSVGKESICNEGGLGSIPGLGRSPGEGNSNPLQYSGLENPMDYPWGRKELDTTEHTHIKLHLPLHSQ